MLLADFKFSTRFNRDKLVRDWRLIAGEGNDDLADGKAPPTIIQYASAWRVYVRWCETHGREPMPASSQQLREYLRHLAALGRSPKTQDSYLAAITIVHRYHGHAVDRTLLIEHLKAARRRAGPDRRARALMGRTIKRVVGKLEPGIAADARDAALMVLGFACALRGAELIGLDWMRAGTTRDRGCTGFVTIEDEGVMVVLNSSKASQTTPVTLRVRDSEMPSLMRWLTRWVEHAKIEPGEPLFRRVTRTMRVLRTRLASSAVTDIIRKRMLDDAISRKMGATEARAYASQHSSHSLRRGYCSTAAEAGMALGLIRARSRHQSDEMLGKYIRDREAWRTSGLLKVGF